MSEHEKHKKPTPEPEPDKPDPNHPTADEDPEAYKPMSKKANPAPPVRPTDKPNKPYANPARDEGVSDD